MWIWIRRSRLDSRVCASLLVGWICFSCFTGSVLCADVTLDSMTIYNAHELLLAPIVYFQCKEENRTFLPDVKKTNVMYTFKGLESWQPLAEFATEKCKRCGFYESDTLKSDDVYDEWEFCPSDFVPPEGKYARSKEGEYNATFSCPECLSFGGGSRPNHAPSGNGKRMHTATVAVIIIISIAAAALLVFGVIRGVKLLQKRRRQQEQARFLKLFEDGDDIEDELGLGTMV